MFEKALPLKPQQEPRTESAPSVSVPRMTLTVEEAADELHISRPIAYELVKEPDFPSVCRAGWALAWFCLYFW